MENQLITYFMELSVMEPERKWSEETFRDNPPRLIRLRRLKALCEAYEIHLSFEKGMHKITPFNTVDLEISNLIIHIHRVDSTGFLKEYSYQINDLILHPENEYEKAWKDFFTDVLTLRLSMYKVNTFSHKYLAVSGLYFFTNLLNLQINKETARVNQILDEILKYLINPKYDEFDVNQLNKRFNYPLGDLDEIDLEWI